MSRITGFCQLSHGDKARALVAAALLLWIWAGITLFPFDRFRSVLVRVGDAGGFLPGSPSIGRIARLVDVVDANLPGHRTCLVRSLTTEVLLRAYDHSFRHRIGVEKTTDGDVQAHSWIEYQDEVLIGQVEDMDRYEVLPPLNDGENL